MRCYVCRIFWLLLIKDFFLSSTIHKQFPINAAMLPGLLFISWYNNIFLVIHMGIIKNIYNVLYSVTIKLKATVRSTSLKKICTYDMLCFELASKIRSLNTRRCRSAALSGSFSKHLSSSSGWLLALAMPPSPHCCCLMIKYIFGHVVNFLCGCTVRSVFHTAAPQRPCMNTIIIPAN